MGHIIIIMTFIILQEWSVTDILVTCRLVRSVNAARGVQNYSIAIFTAPESIMGSLHDFQTQMVYYHDRSITAKGKKPSTVKCNNN